MWHYNAEHPVRRYFSGLTEHAFIESLGLADPPLIDYLSILLSRFVHMDTIYKLRSSTGQRLEEVADMLMEVEELPPEGRTSREMHRHIGDFTLFWTGVFPEALKRLRSSLHKDHFIDYCEQGKRSYLIASTFEDGALQGRVLRAPEAPEQPVRGLCAYRPDAGAARNGSRKPMPKSE